MLRLPHRNDAKSTVFETPLHVSLNISAARPSFKNLYWEKRARWVSKTVLLASWGNLHVVELLSESYGVFYFSKTHYSTVKLKADRKVIHICPIDYKHTDKTLRPVMTKVKHFKQERSDRKTYTTKYIISLAFRLIKMALQSLLGVLYYLGLSSM